MEIDRIYLRELYMGDRAYALEMFELFLEEGTPQVENLRRALNQEAWPEVRYYAHKIKPAMAMVGFPGVSLALEKLEMAAREENSSQAQVLFSRFMDLFIKIKPMVAETYSELQNGII